ncbi:MAG: carboxypeptidase M32, partial [Gammaproteobacteria bacterium]
SHEILTAKKVGQLIEQASQTTLDNDWDRSNLEGMRKKYLNAVSLPNKLVKALTECSLECTQAWRKYRQANDWKSFAPYLKKVVELVKESANTRAQKFGLDPYDILLDDFSTGVTQAYIDPIFDQLRKEIPEILSQVKQQKQFKDLSGDYPLEQQKNLARHVMQSIGFDFNYGRLDESHHPFCGGSPRDVRITTRYDNQNFIPGLMGICHETGHAMYERHLPAQWLDQPVGAAVGMTIHESQSLLVEMQACRTQAFSQYITQLFPQFFPDHDKISESDFYASCTHVQPDLIRVDADEVTYPLHIILRYEIEKQLLNDTIGVDDLPELWDQMMQELLGISTRGNDKDGVMQDVHWPSALFGYFPAYTLGAIFAAQQMVKVNQQYPNAIEKLAKGDFSEIMAWLQKNVHAQASLYDTPGLIKQATGEPLTSKYFIAHLRQRY